MILLALAACKPPAPPSTPENQGQHDNVATGPVIVPSDGLEADLAATEAFFDTRPTVERPLRETGIDGVRGLGPLSAESCRPCHAEIYDEWRTSVHAQAWIDPQFQAEIHKSGNRWLCLDCHTPLLVQHDRWPRALIDDDVERPVLADNPTFDAALRDEGITCTACHLRQGAIVGPGLSDGPSNAPHEVIVDPSLRSADLCLACHQAEATYANKSFVCTFDTGDEWREGPWDDEGKVCSSCHMPAIERPAAAGGPVRTVRRHWWRGAGIPKIEGRYPPPEANPPGLALSATVAQRTLHLDLENARAGHRLPTGDPERWVQIDVRFLDGAGESIGEPWQHRIGQTWAWTTPPRKLDDNRLAPREQRTFDLPIPEGARQAVVDASSHRISEENAAYHHLDGYPRSVQTHHIELTLD